MAKKWTDEEKEILTRLLERPGVYTYLELADVLNRPISGVQRICSQLNLQSNVKRAKSQGEEVLFTLLREIYPTLAITKQHPVGERLHLDLYIPDLFLGFEYDGIQHSEENTFFHKDRDAFLRGQILDDRKDDLCASQGIHLIRVSHEENLCKEVLLEKISIVGPGSGNNDTAPELTIQEKAKRYYKKQHEIAKTNNNNSDYYKELTEKGKQYRKERYLYLKSIKKQNGK